jgi:hypothetical protein
VVSEEEPASELARLRARLKANWPGSDFKETVIDALEQMIGEAEEPRVDLS